MDLYCSEECRLVHESAKTRIKELELLVGDHAQRFETLQTPWWRRLWFWIDGWPWYDLNGTRAWRPWHGLQLEVAIRSIRVD